MSESPQFLIPSIYIWPMKTICAERMIDVQRLCAKVGFSANVVLYQNVLVDQIKFIQLINEGAKATNEDLIGLLIGKELTLQNSGPIGQLLACQTCIANIYPIINYMFNGENRGVRHEMIVRGRNAFHEIRYMPLVEKQVNCDNVGMLSLTGYINTFRQLLGETWSPTRVYLRKKKVARAEVLEAHYGCPVVLGAELDAMEFPIETIYLETQQTIDRSRKMKVELADILMSQRELDKLVASYIEFNLSDNGYSKTHIAKHLGVHPKVLQRCLSENGFEFKNILSDVRQKKAKELLSTTTLPIADIAIEVGYMESRTFVQAFRKWTGNTPLKWRKTIEKGQQ